MKAVVLEETSCFHPYHTGLKGSYQMKGHFSLLDQAVVALGECTRVCFMIMQMIGEKYFKRFCFLVI